MLRWSRVLIAMPFAIPATWSAPAAASTYGCQVLLCLSNPTGPMAFGACVPPITKLWRELAVGISFPTCTEGGIQAAFTTGRRGSDSYTVTMVMNDGSRTSYGLGTIGYGPPVVSTAPGPRSRPAPGEQQQ